MRLIALTSEWLAIGGTLVISQTCLQVLEELAIWRYNANLLTVATTR